MADEFKVFEIDDDFDPLEDLHMDVEEEDEGEQESDYQVPEIAPEDQIDLVQVEDTATVQERMEGLFTGMPGQKTRLLSAVALCRERVSLEEFEEKLNAEFPNDRSVYAPARVAQLLERAGAIVSEVEDADTEDPGASEPAADASGSQEPGEGGAGAGASDAQGSGAQEPGAQETPGPEAKQPAGPADAQDEPFGDAPDAADDDDYLMVAPPTVTYYVATEEGLALVEDQMGAAPILQAINENDGAYRHVYEAVLRAAAAEGGTTAKQLDAVLEGDPVLEEPRRFSTYFLRKLEEADALRWLDAWVATDAGRAVLESEFTEGE